MARGMGWKRTSINRFRSRCWGLIQARHLRCGGDSDGKYTAIGAGKVIEHSSGRMRKRCCR